MEILLETGFQSSKYEVSNFFLVIFINIFVYYDRISTWDLHREKVVVLTEKTLFVVTYDFIKLKIYDYKRINLTDLRKVNFGQLKYPPSSMMG